MRRTLFAAATEVQDQGRVPRKIWQTLRLQGLVINTASAVQEVLHDLTAAEKLMGGQWSAHGLADKSDTRSHGHMQVSIPPGGFKRATVHRLLLTFGRKKCTHADPMGLFVPPSNLSDWSDSMTAVQG
jgi:hypothetical protein